MISTSPPVVGLCCHVLGSLCYPCRRLLWCHHFTDSNHVLCYLHVSWGYCFVLSFVCGAYGYFPLMGCRKEGIAPCFLSPAGRVIVGIRFIPSHTNDLSFWTHEEPSLPLPMLLSMFGDVPICHCFLRCEILPPHLPTFSLYLDVVNFPITLPTFLRLWRDCVAQLNSAL